jgi:hypothetical protein
MVFRSALAGIVLAFTAAAAATTAFAQSPYCDRLRAELSTVERAAASTGGSENAAAIRRMESELDRTIAYARSIGCQGQRRFVLFGEPDQQQCRQIERQINQLESNLAALQAEAGRNAGGSLETRRSALVAAIDANCRTANSGGPRGLFDLLFGGGQGRVIIEEMPDTPLGTEDAGGMRTICVRKCDGYYFPVSSYANSGRFGLDADLCRATCPAAETALYLQPIGKDVDTAIAVDGGAPYTALPNALKYRKAFDSSCSCRRPGQSWSEALAEAERVLAVNGRSDAIVTEQRSLELSRARAPAPTPRSQTPTAQKPQTGGQANTVMPGAPGSAVAPTAEVIETIDENGRKKTIRVINPAGAGTTAASAR